MAYAFIPCGGGSPVLLMDHLDIIGIFCFICIADLPGSVGGTIVYQDQFHMFLKPDILTDDTVYSLFQVIFYIIYCHHYRKSVFVF